MIRRLWPVLPALLFALDAFARAGGGGGYHGGGGFHSGGGFSGGSHGGSGGGDIVGLWFWLVWHHPYVGIPLTCFLVWLAYQANDSRIERREAYIDSTISRGMDRELDTRRREALAVIRSRDPQFDEASFLSRAAGAFAAIQDAWSGMDMSKARAFVSDGVYERFSRQIAEYKERGIRNRMSGVKILETEALGYLTGAHWDSVYVRIKASAVDEIVRLDGDEVVSGGPDVFTEVWTFLRRPGAKTLARPGLLEGHCPSCGAPLPIADAAQCSACKAWVNSGEHDWVLTEITQMCEWSFPAPDRDVTGWDAYRDADPDLSLEALEDRASVAFWRWLDARRRRDLAPLRGIAADECLGRVELDGTFERDAAVGMVQTAAVEPGADFDKVHVQVRWEADRMQRADGAEPSCLGRDRRTHFLVFRRKAGAKSDLKAGLRTSRCPSCGAPPEQADAAACAYCGRKLNDGAVAWVLWDIVPFGLWRRPSAAHETPIAVSGLQWGEDLPAVEAVAVLATGLAADGAVEDRERAFLMAYADRRGVEPTRAEQMVQAALEKRLDVPAPKDAAEAEAMLRGLIRMTLADGRVNDSERALLRSFGGRLGLPEKAVGEMIQEERKTLHDRAAALLGERRPG